MSVYKGLWCEDETIAMGSPKQEPFIRVVKFILMLYMGVGGTYDGLQVMLKEHQHGRTLA